MMSHNMKKYLFTTVIVLVSVLTLSSAYSQIVSGQTQNDITVLKSGLTIPVWSGIAPGSGDRPQDDDNSAQPTITAYLPDESKSKGTAVIICPGGAFRALSNEEAVSARWTQRTILIALDYGDPSIIYQLS